jgi:Fe-S-cluster containining protein
MKSLVVIREYAEHANAVDREFRREFEIYKDRMQCGRGCSMCCSQMFSISTIEAAYISRAVKSMPETERDRLRSAAQDYATRARAMTASSDSSEREESITPRPGLRLPCPALDGDACSIYDARPIICRKWGIPVFNPKKPLELQACELNFRPGEEIEVDGIVEPQARLLEEWVQLKERAQQELERSISTTTVAEALIRDYEEILFGESRSGVASSDRTE